MKKLKFEWHDEKAMRNITKHGISFLEATSVFSDSLSLITHDKHHSYDEDRWTIIGTSNFNTLLVITFTDRQEKIRLISARKATKSERKKYEKN